MFPQSPQGNVATSRRIARGGDGDIAAGHSGSSADGRTLLFLRISERLEFLLVHNLPVGIAGVNIIKTGNYTISITVLQATAHSSMLIVSMCLILAGEMGPSTCTSSTAR